MKLNHTLAAVFAATALSSSASAAVSMIIGINDNGDMRIVNNSTSTEYLISLTVSFPTDPVSGTFFDTDPANPGNASSPFTSSVNSGTATVSLPDDSNRDGEQSASFGFDANMTSGSDISLGFDLDAFDNIDGSGNAAIAQFLAVFITSGGTETPTFYAHGAGTVSGESFDQVFRTVPVPEPSSAALLGLGGIALILRRRK